MCFFRLTLARRGFSREGFPRRGLHPSHAFPQKKRIRETINFAFSQIRFS